MSKGTRDTKFELTQPKPVKWRRYRFYGNLEDSRPIKFPPPGPWWESGFGDTHSVIVCYLPIGVSVKDYWPEAVDIEWTNEDKIIYTDRFPKPDWWKGE